MAWQQQQHWIQSAIILTTINPRQRDIIIGRVILLISQSTLAECTNIFPKVASQWIRYPARNAKGRLQIIIKLSLKYLFDNKGQMASRWIDIPRFSCGSSHSQKSEGGRGRGGGFETIVSIKYPWISDKISTAFRCHAVRPAPNIISLQPLYIPAN